MSGAATARTWDDPAKVETLTTLWKGGKSASEIGRVLGVGRLAVIGKVHRMGLGRYVRGAAAVPGAAPLKAPTVKSDKYAGNGFNARGGKPAPFKVSDNGRVYTQPASLPLDVKVETANDNAILLISRSRFQCAWPVGEPDRPANQLCCGQPVPDDAPRATPTYCPTHVRKALATSPRTPTASREYVRKLVRYA